MTADLLEPRPQMLLRLKMTQRGLSVRDVARMAGVEYTSASRILAGHKKRPFDLQKIERAIESVPPADVDMTAQEVRSELLNEVRSHRPSQAVSISDHFIRLRNRS